MSGGAERQRAPRRDPARRELACDVRVPVRPPGVPEARAAGLLVRVAQPACTRVVLS